MEAGSIVSYTPRDGEQPYIAVVQYTWPDGSLQLYAFHHQASANIRSAKASECRLIVGPEQIMDMHRRIDRLEDLFNFLVERQNRQQPANEQQADTAEEETETKPAWPSSSSAQTSRARRQSSN